MNDWILRCEDAWYGLAGGFHEEGVVEVTLSNPHQPLFTLKG
jgi:hypothetical protein